MDTFSDEDAAIAALPRDGVVQIFHRLQDPESWICLQDPLVQEIKLELWQLEDAFAELCSRDRGLRPCIAAVPRPLGRWRYILHAYSGRRRYGDVQHFLDRCSQRYPEVTVQMLSVDVIIDGTFGNLMSDTTQAFWIEAIRSGLVVGLLAGPPCNSWSKVRKRAIQGARHGPRPIRSLEFP